MTVLGDSNQYMKSWPQWMTQPLPDDVLRKEALGYRLKLAEARALMTAYFTAGETSPEYRENLISQLRELLKESP